MAEQQIKAANTHTGNEIVAQHRDEVFIKRKRDDGESPMERFFLHHQFFAVHVDEKKEKKERDPKMFGGWQNVKTVMEGRKEGRTTKYFLRLFCLFFRSPPVIFGQWRAKPAKET